LNFTKALAASCTLVYDAKDTIGNGLKMGYPIIHVDRYAVHPYVPRTSNASCQAKSAIT